MATVYRSVVQPFKPPAEMLGLLEEFRLMLNDCVRLCFDSWPRSFEQVKAMCYPRLKQYQVDNSYRVSAMYDATNLLKKFRSEATTGNPSKPYCRSPYLSASIGVYIEGDELVLPDGRRILLNRHTKAVLLRPGVEVNSVVITPHNVGIVYRKEVAEAGQAGIMALDLNLGNVTTYDAQGRSEVYDLSALTQIHERSRRVTRRFRRNDRRVRRRIFRKYASIERNRKVWVLHNVSSSIVSNAADRRQTIVMENLKGLRKAFRTESGSTKDYLSKMNAWPFAELQRQVDYKARSEGLKVVYIDPQGTSNECSRCGGGMRESPETHPVVTCRKCGLVIDRDLNAAKVILSRGARSAPVASADEAMEGRGKEELSTKVDADDSASQKE